MLSDYCQHGFQNPTWIRFQMTVSGFQKPARMTIIREFSRLISQAKFNFVNSTLWYTCRQVLATCPVNINWSRGEIYRTCSFYIRNHKAHEASQQIDRKLLQDTYSTNISKRGTTNWSKKNGFWLSICKKGIRIVERCKPTWLPNFKSFISRWMTTTEYQKRNIRTWAIISIILLQNQ